MPKSLPIWSARGSEWHRWDPHIHAPGTVLEDGFAGDWEGYLTKIECATPTIRALGVTDYCSIETYRQVRQRKAGGRLPKVDFLFPNVEMRLDVKTVRAKGINIYLLFSPDDTDHEQQIERVLSLDRSTGFAGSPWRSIVESLAATFFADVMTTATSPANFKRDQRFRITRID